MASLSYDALLAAWDRLYLESGPNQKAAIEVVKAELSSREAPPERETEIVAALEREAYVVRRDPALVSVALGG